jgi:hypothetical protein
MAVLIDPPIWPAHGRRWSHLVSDVSLRELHIFAGGIGIPERGFEGDHYDIPEERYAHTVAAGAIPVSGRELLRRLQGSGLRRPKRRGERVLASRLGPTPGVRVDVILSALAPIGAVTAAHVVVTTGRDLLVLPDDVGYRLPGQAVDHGEPDVAAAAAALVAGLVDHAVAPGMSVGYVRRVRLADGRILENEVVLRFVLGGGPDQTPPAGGARAARTAGAVWVPVRQAVALLDGDVAPLAAGTAYRQPDRAAPAPD